MDLVGNSLLWFNIIGGFLCGVVNLIYIHQNAKYSWIWIKWGYATLGFYWSLVYLYLLIYPESLETVRAMLRPGISLGISLMLAGSFVRLDHVYIPDVFCSVLKKFKKEA
jgi:hypothetical protein